MVVVLIHFWEASSSSWILPERSGVIRCIQPPISKTFPKIVHMVKYVIGGFGSVFQLSLHILYCSTSPESWYLQLTYMFPLTCTKFAPSSGKGISVTFVNLRLVLNGNNVEPHPSIITFFLVNDHGDTEVEVLAADIWLLDGNAIWKRPTSAWRFETVTLMSSFSWLRALILSIISTLLAKEGGWSAATALTLWWTSEEEGRWEGLLLRHLWIKDIRGCCFSMRLMYSSRRLNSVTPITSSGSCGLFGFNRTASPGNGHCPLNICTIITP